MGRTRRYSWLLLRKVINRHKSNPSSVRSACWGQNQSDGFLKTVKTGNVFRFWRVICWGGRLSLWVQTSLQAHKEFVHFSFYFCFQWLHRCVQRLLSSFLSLLQRSAPVRSWPAGLSSKSLTEPRPNSDTSAHTSHDYMCTQSHPSLLSFPQPSVSLFIHSLCPLSHVSAVRLIFTSYKTCFCCRAQVLCATQEV